MNNGSIDNWLDYLIKRWPVAVLIGILVLGVAKTQWVQNAQASQLEKIDQTLDDLADMKGEWPYLKQKVEKMDDKIDVLLQRSKPV